uniref:Uncharacterized protein n=1 Tax=Arundo donax TaxID=35708 RepID=A0A0A8Z5K1_ARUDO
MNFRCPHYFVTPLPVASPDSRESTTHQPTDSDGVKSPPHQSLDRNQDVPDRGTVL